MCISIKIQRNRLRVDNSINLILKKDKSFFTNYDLYYINFFNLINDRINKKIHCYILMAEPHIFDIIKKEKINISEIDTYNINKFFLRYYQIYAFN